MFASEGQRQTLVREVSGELKAKWDASVELERQELLQKLNTFHARIGGATGCTALGTALREQKKTLIELAATGAAHPEAAKGAREAAARAIDDF